ncbi:hypothetical protein [Nonomuraea salmonea]|uniref:alpha/beta hydrolase family protein n=1 Tax=Nonomuraea salmonea TaxID=46181 RepID=UPI002FE9BF09
MLSVRKSAGLLLLVALLALLQPVRQAAATDPTATDPTATDLTATDVSFTSDGRTLHGTLLAPAGARGLPAMVLVAGSGSTSRAAYQPEAEAFARAGVVTLVYDKRAGYSRATTSFDDLATDALAALDLLRRRPEADPRQTGLWGAQPGRLGRPPGRRTRGHGRVLGHGGGPAPCVLIARSCGATAPTSRTPASPSG